MNYCKSNKNGEEKNRKIATRKVRMMDARREKEIILALEK